MKIFGLAGWSGSGKTTLLVRLVEEFVARGVTVSTIKHAHHNFEIDRPGKDSFRHRTAGAAEVMIGTARRWALIHEHRGAPEPGLDELLARMMPVDLVLIEGFKWGAYPKLEVHRGENGGRILCTDDPNIVAIAADRPIPEAGVPRFELDDVAAIADFILDCCGVGEIAEEAGRGAAQ